MRAYHLFFKKQRRAPLPRGDDTLSISQVRWLGALMLATQMPMIALGAALDRLPRHVARRLAVRADRALGQGSRLAAGHHPLVGAGTARVRHGDRDPRVARLFRRPRSLRGVPVRADRHQVSRNAPVARRHADRLPRVPADRDAVLLQPVAARRGRGDSRDRHARRARCRCSRGPRRSARCKAAGARRSPARSRCSRRAIPLAVVLFLLFPRVSGPLWGVPADHAAQSGLSDHMAPGIISELSLSDAVAFRVDFDGPVPPPWQRYWRGPVLTRLRRPRMVDAGAPDPRDRSRGRTAAPVVYTVTLEPHWKPWLFALDLPGSLPQTTADDVARACAPTSTRCSRATSSCWRACPSRSRCAISSRRSLRDSLPGGTRRRARARHQGKPASCRPTGGRSIRGRSTSRASCAQTHPRRHRPTSTPCSTGSIANRSSTRSRRRCSAPIRWTASCSGRAAASASTMRAPSS